MNSVDKEKKALREKILTSRKEIPEEEWREKSNHIISNLINSDFFEPSRVVHTYLSMNDRKEVCTDYLLSYLFKMNKKVVVPITNFEEHKLIHSEINSLSDLKTNTWGVREPKNIIPVEIEDLDLIVVPMNAADRKGNRLGYGKGFYDRFLSQSKAIKAGLIFDDYIFEDIPVNTLDIKMDVLISEKGTFNP